MGRRRRKIIKRVVKPFPRVFTCPICNEQAVTVYHEEGSSRAKVMCANCKASAEVRWLPAYMPVDAYAEFYDIVTGAKRPAELEAGRLGGPEVEEGSIEPQSNTYPQLQGGIHETSESGED